MAREGATAAQISTRYYTGAAGSAVADAVDLRVNPAAAGSTSVVSDSVLASLPRPRCGGRTGVVSLATGMAGVNA